ncbi:hypothetical protein ABT215_13730 [Streptomyces sp900105755]|uniref:hypothetical protein n=1 Tax=Streptomyces sp. 900105755 TaxID=3154389 RepID=UPI003329CFB9
MHAPEATRLAPVPRVLALLTLTWALAGCPVGTASADACAYASTGPDGSYAVAVAGGSWPTPPPCPAPTPPPCPEPKPTPTPSPKPTPRPSPTPVTYPPYHVQSTGAAAPNRTSPVTYVLLIAVPAIIAVAAFRAR